MIRITYPGSNNFSSFAYDARGRNVSIVETVAGSVTSTKQFVWSGSNHREERDASGALTKKFFGGGQMNSTSKYFYDSDHLDSVREMTDNSGNKVAEYAFDPYGQVTKISETIASDFGYAGYYVHSRSGLNPTRTRAYSCVLARFINRDPIEESGGLNLYAYVSNAPIAATDPSGLFKFDPKVCCQVESALNRLRAVSYENGREMGVPFNVDSNGNVTFGADRTGRTWKGPIYGETGFNNVGMTHALFGAWDMSFYRTGFPPTGSRSGFADSDWERADEIPWTINDDGNMFVIADGHLYMMMPGCKECWDLGTKSAPIKPGIKKCP